MLRFAGRLGIQCSVQYRSDLVFAARAEHVENHQLRIREKPLFGFRTSGSSSANQGSKVLGLRQGSQMLQANSS